MSDLKPHYCHSGGMDLILPPAVSIMAGSGRAVLALTGYMEGNGQELIIGMQINSCPICSEPLSATGVKLDRIKRVEGLK